MTKYILLASLALVQLAVAYQVDIHPENQAGLAINDVPADRRLHWMRVANQVSQGFLSLRQPRRTLTSGQAVYDSGHPCPQAPFGTAIVNTTSDELVCVIANAVGTTGG